MRIVISVILLFGAIGVLVLIHACVVGRRLRRSLSENNLMSMVDRGSLVSSSMSRDDIEKLPCFDFQGKVTGTSPPGDCVVCLERFRPGEKCRLLPSCNHSFHAECVDLWLLRAAVCPVCRAGADVVRDFGESAIVIGETGLENEPGIGVPGESGNFDGSLTDRRVDVEDRGDEIRDRDDIIAL